MRVVWKRACQRDLARLPGNHRAKVKAIAETWLASEPPFGRSKLLSLGPPWGPIHQMSIDEYRVLYDVSPETGTREIVVVFEKKEHMSTVQSLKWWLAEEFAARRGEP